MNLENITNTHIKETIAEYIHSQKVRDVLLDRYINGYTFEQIAELHDMSTVQIKRIVYKNELNIVNHL